MSVTGYAILRVRRNAVRVADAGVCRTSSKESLEARLAAIEGDFDELLAQHAPAVVAVEKLYAHYRHPRTAVIMGHVRGVILSAAARYGVQVRGYGATRIKRFLTGNGRASKRQVQHAVMRELNLRELPEPTDVADALAVALCCIGDTAGIDAGNEPRTSVRAVR